MELSFNAEVSNVLFVNAQALGDKEWECTVKFDMFDLLLSDFIRSV